MLGMNYRAEDRVEATQGYGTVSRYAWGQRDYHDLIHPRLKRLTDLIQQRVPGSHARGVVDTAPLHEREFAQLAGLGWIGKHTLLIHPGQGELVFPRRNPDGLNFGLRRAFPHRPLRSLPSLSGRMPDECVSTAVRLGCPALHQLPDD